MTALCGAEPGAGRDPPPYHSSFGTAQTNAYRPAALQKWRAAAVNSSAAPPLPARTAGGAAGRCGATRAASGARVVIACRTSKDAMQYDGIQTRQHYTHGGGSAGDRRRIRRGVPA